MVKCMDEYARRAGLLRVAAHPVRLQILEILSGAGECVCHLSAALARPQPYVSQQLAVLRKAGLVIDEKAGTNSFYHLAGADVARQVAGILGLPVDDRRSETSEHHQPVPGCICPKCRHVDLATPCEPLHSSVQGGEG
jgi:DNA-binding transcriptional ArsR family regulator